MTDNPAPLVVNPDPTAAQLGAAGRYALAALGSFALGRGWISSDLLQLVTALSTVVAPLGYGVWLTRRNRQRLVTAARADPGDVRIVR